MTNEGIKEFINLCNLDLCEELIPNSAYYYKPPNEDKDSISEMIILVKDNVRVGGINLAFGPDIHIYMKDQYRGQHIMSSFLKTGIIKQLWPQVTSTELCDVHTQEEYDKKRHLAAICNLSIKNAAKIERRLSYIKLRKIQQQNNTIQTKEDISMKKRTTCDKCNSLLEYDDKSTHEGNRDFEEITCPICKAIVTRVFTNLTPIAYVVKDFE